MIIDAPFIHHIPSPSLCIIGITIKHPIPSHRPPLGAAAADGMTAIAEVYDVMNKSVLYIRMYREGCDEPQICAQINRLTGIRLPWFNWIFPKRHGHQMARRYKMGYTMDEIRSAHWTKLVKVDALMSTDAIDPIGCTDIYGFMLSSEDDSIHVYFDDIADALIARLHGDKDEADKRRIRQSFIEYLSKTFIGIHMASKEA